MPRRHTKIVTLACLLIATSTAACWFLFVSSREAGQSKSDSAGLASEQLLRERKAKDLLSVGNFEGALDVCETGLKAEPTRSQLLIIAGEAATKLGRFKEAIDYYSSVKEDDPKAAALASWAAGEIYYHLGLPSDCVDSLRTSLQLEPQRVEAHERLLWTLCVTGQRQEIVPHAMMLLRSDLTTIPLLVELGNLWTEFQDWQEIERFRSASPDDPLLMLIDANQLFVNGQLQESEIKLDQTLMRSPDLLAAHILRGKIWLRDDPQRWNLWNQALPQSADESSDIWHVRGQWQETLGDSRAATRCYAEAVNRSPNHLAAHLDLARMLAGFGEEYSGVAISLAKRGAALQVLQQTVDRIRINDRYEETVRLAAEKCVQLSRAWEAIGWCGYGMQLNPQATWPKELLEKIRATDGVGSTMDHTLPQGRLLKESTWVVDFQLPMLAYPSELGPALTQAMQGQMVQDAFRSQDESKVRFEEIAISSGIEFRYHRSGQDRSLGRRMFEFTGGGVGVIDFDSDGCEDIFLSQATDWPQGSTAATSDKLYRSTGLIGAGSKIRFDDCSTQALIVENGYGQGVTVADMNADGFDDIYVGNYGPNQLWINQGDGTFDSGQRYLESEAPPYWTTSTLCVDLNGDAIPELVDINYVIGENVEELRCDVDGRPRVCPPLVFQPAPLEIHVAEANGKFSRYPWPDGQLAFNGLGAVAFRAAGSGEFRLFVASDQNANGLLSINANVDSSESDESRITLSDSAILSGIAYDRNGLAQACMGIAVGDLTGNGEMDLIVTNFFGETNTVYIQDEGSFSDQTLRWGLATASRPMLGFGAQLFDATLDGVLDLAVLNGHIDDFAHVGIPEKMPPQLFVGTGQKSFNEIPHEKLGTFFQTPALGRSMAIADINQDGLIELLCTDLEAPFAILENRSDVEGDYVGIELVGTESDRNGFLSILEVKSGDYRVSGQMVAGGGYMASNSHHLYFALPKTISQDVKLKAGAARDFEERVADVQVTVKWPSGLEELFPDLSRNSRNQLVEGRGVQIKKNR